MVKDFFKDEKKLFFLFEMHLERANNFISRVKNSIEKSTSFFYNSKKKKSQ